MLLQVLANTWRTERANTKKQANTMHSYFYFQICSLATHLKIAPINITNQTQEVHTKITNQHTAQKLWQNSVQLKTRNNNETATDNDKIPQTTSCL